MGRIMSDRAWRAALRYGDAVLVVRYLQPPEVRTVTRRTARYVVVDGVKYAVSDGRRQRSELTSRYMPRDRIEVPL